MEADRIRVEAQRREIILANERLSDERRRKEEEEEHEEKRRECERLDAKINLVTRELERLLAKVRKKSSWKKSELARVFCALT